MTGGKQKQKYQERLRGSGDDMLVLCRRCDNWRPPSEFHKQKGNYKSTCKSCHREKYGKGSGYKPPSEIKRSQEAKDRRQSFLNEIVQCVSCGEGKPRSEYFISKERGYSYRCCSPRRSDEQVQIDISEGMKSCTTCEMRLPFSEFSAGGGGRDGVRSSCKCCEAARLKFHSGRDERLSQIRDTDDGTASLVVLSQMLRGLSHCEHCGVEMTQSYPVKSSNKTIDHKTPLSRGGKHTLENIAVMCLGCNSSKGNRTMAEFERVKKKTVL